LAAAGSCYTKERWQYLGLLDSAPAELVTAEMLLKFLICPVYKDILAVKQTSKRLRYFVIHNSASTCNDIVTNYYGDVTTLLQPIQLEGWLVSQHPAALSQGMRVLHGMTTQVMRSDAQWPLAVRCR
jgi:hypothetical protein